MVLVRNEECAVMIMPVNRFQTNMVTHYMDASFVYGSSADVASQLRSFSNGLFATRNINGEEHLITDDQGDLLAGKLVPIYRNVCGEKEKKTRHRWYSNLHLSHHCRCCR